MPDEEEIEVRCPVCGKTARVPAKQAERDFKARCPDGHEIPLVKAI
ncbi:MAG: hypothetical protein KC657_15025 [Myxococcales bacterium]|nr:hypothetical protein [Myxococcales bacterium]